MQYASSALTSPKPFRVNARTVFRRSAKELYQFHVQRVGVDVAVDRHSLDAELLSGADDATRDFASV